ncbi:MAG: aldo/keto reductase [Acidobacteriota bacterium]|nr:aldo/keto reductase [Acidobacteriota bacterium]
MQTTALGKTGLTVPRVCFGTMTFGSQVDQTEAQKIFDRCLDTGVNFIDTANVYNKGESERMLGRCMKGRRDKIVLASKVRGSMGSYEGLSRTAIFKAIDESLERLGTDYLDLYYLHHPDYTVPLEESLEAMQDLVKAGKIRFPALSNYASWQVTEAQWIASQCNYTPATVTQPMYNLLARGLEPEYLPMCEHFGIFTCVYNPLAGGLLTGKQRAGDPLPGTRFDSNQMYLDRYWHPAQFEAVERLDAAARAHGRTLLSVALNWIYRHTSASCMILGASRLQQLEQNLAALDDGPLPEELLKACDSVWAGLRGVTPKYNR